MASKAKVARFMFACNPFSLIGVLAPRARLRGESPARAPRRTCSSPRGTGPAEGTLAGPRWRTLHGQFPPTGTIGRLIGKVQEIVTTPTRGRVCPIGRRASPFRRVRRALPRRLLASGRRASCCMTSPWLARRNLIKEADFSALATDRTRQDVARGRAPLPSLAPESIQG